FGLTSTRRHDRQRCTGCTRGPKLATSRWLSCTRRRGHSCEGSLRLDHDERKHLAGDEIVRQHVPDAGGVELVFERGRIDGLRLLGLQALVEPAGRTGP